MKAIMISMKPKWCAKIMNGEKTIEVRKNKALANAIQKLIDKNGFADIYVYCTKEKATRNEDMSTRGRHIWFNKGYAMNRQYLINGKVPFKFRCYKAEEIKVDFYISKNGYYGTYLLSEPVFKKTSCLTHKDLKEYLRGDEKCNDVQNIGYAIHISNLEIFDRPKELDEFNIYCDKHELCKCDYCKRLKQSFIEFGFAGEYCDSRLTKAPQNMVYIEVE